MANIPAVSDEEPYSHATEKISPNRSDLFLPIQGRRYNFSMVAPLSCPTVLPSPGTNLMTLPGQPFPNPNLRVHARI